MNIEWDNTHNFSKIDLPSSIQNKFDDIHLYEQNVHISSKENVQRYEIRHMNKIIRDIKNSVLDSEFKWYKEFTKSIGRQEFYVNGYVTWSQKHYLEVPGQTTLSYPGIPGFLHYKCCYFSINENHDYYLQAWNRKKTSDTKLYPSDLIRARYGQMRIFPDYPIHGGGFNNTNSNNNFIIQILIKKNLNGVNDNSNVQ